MRGASVMWVDEVSLRVCGRLCGVRGKCECGARPDFMWRGRLWCVACVKRQVGAGVCVLVAWVIDVAPRAGVA